MTEEAFVMAGGSKGRRRRRGCFLKFVMAGVLLVMVALTAVHLLKNVAVIPVSGI